MDSLPRLILAFPFWWYVDGSRFFLRLSKNLVLFLDRQLVVSLMFRLWGQPLFGDLNLVGRTIGFIFRSLRIIYGLLAMLSVELFLLLGFGLWLFWPLLLLTNFFGLVATVVAAILIFYLKVHCDQAPQKIGEVAGHNLDAGQFMKPSLAKLLSQNQRPRELLSALIKRKVPRQVLGRLGFATEAEFLAALGDKTHVLTGVPLTDLLRQSLQIAIELKHEHVASVHLLLAFLRFLKFKETEALEILSWSNREYDRRHPPQVWDKNYAAEGLGGFNRSWTGRVTPALDRFSRDLTRAAQAGLLPPLIGKEKALLETIRVLERTSKSNVILVGDPGCGKTTLVFGLAQEIVRGTAKASLSDKRLVMLDLSKITAGAKTGGEVQGRMEEVLDDVLGSGNIILFVDEIHNAVTAGGDINTAIIFSTLEPKIGQGFQLIGATSWENYRKYIEPNQAFARLFERVEMAEAGFDESLKILEYLSIWLEAKNKVLITLAALQACIELSRKYIYERVLPDKAVDLLEEVVADVVLQNRSFVLIRPEDVQRIVSEKTQIPVALATSGSSESKNLLNLEAKLHERLIDQGEAVTAVADAIRRARTGLREERRPITSLLFVGPTGVGKTETAKTLAATFYGSEERLIRFDMSEFQAESSVDSLVAKLSDAVRHHPFSLVLFDEIEKASSRLLDIFLQVVDDGRLTDVLGHTVTFANCVLIFTSNAGTSFIFSELRAGRNIDAFKNDLFKKLEGSFRIELLNRFDGIVVYKPLLSEHVEMIARLKLKKIAQEMLGREYQISFSEGLIKRLAIEGYDVALGARPMRRLIQDRIESSLAKMILSGGIKKGEPLVLEESVLSL